MRVHHVCDPGVDREVLGGADGLAHARADDLAPLAGERVVQRPSRREVVEAAHRLLGHAAHDARDRGHL